MVLITLRILGNNPTIYPELSTNILMIQSGRHTTLIVPARTQSHLKYQIINLDT